MYTLQSSATLVFGHKVLSWAQWKHQPKESYQLIWGFHAPTGKPAQPKLSVAIYSDGSVREWTVVHVGGISSYILAEVYGDLTFLVAVGRPFGAERWAAEGVESLCESGGRGKKQGLQMSPSHGCRQHDTVARSRGGYVFGTVWGDLVFL